MHFKRKLKLAHKKNQNWMQEALSQKGFKRGRAVERKETIQSTLYDTSIVKMTTHFFPFQETVEVDVPTNDCALR